MSGMVAKSSGEAWTVASWTYRHMVRLVLEHLDRNDPLVERLIEAERSGLLMLDLRSVSSSELERFRRALTAAYADAASAGPSSFGTPEFYPGFMDRFRELLELLEVPVPSGASSPPASA